MLSFGLSYSWKNMKRLLFRLVTFIAAINIIIIILYNITTSEKSGRFSWRYSCEPINNTNVAHYRVTLDGQEYPKSTPLYLNKSLNFDCLNEETSTSKSLILFWTSGMGFEAQSLSPDCPVTNCELSVDKTRLYESDFVVAHILDKIQDLPLNYERPFMQRWIFLLFESPVHSAHRIDYAKYNGFFNLSATYKRDSDFPVSWHDMINNV